MKYETIPLEACPRNGTKRRTYLPYVLEGRMVRLALLITLICIFSACTQTSNYPLYTGSADSIAPTDVGTGYIHALDGNLVW